MSDDIESEECLDDFLKDFINIKNTGAPCKVTEARAFYKKIINKTKEDVVKGLGFYLMQIAQNIPYSKISKKVLNNIIDDGDCMIEYISIFNGWLPLIHDLNKHPSSYNAWKGKIKVKVNDKEKEEDAYYVELKSIEEKIKEIGGLYI